MAVKAFQNSVASWAAVLALNTRPRSKLNAAEPRLPPAVGLMSASGHVFRDRVDAV
jgi:hypothetical protein